MACLVIELLFVHMFVCVCMFCTGHRLLGAGLGDHTGMEYQLEHLESWTVCFSADGEHGGHSTGPVQKTAQTSERIKGQFYHTEFIK